MSYLKVFILPSISLKYVAIESGDGQRFWHQSFASLEASAWTYACMLYVLAVAVASLLEAFVFSSVSLKSRAINFGDG